jgi:hypothetical protein
MSEMVYQAASNIQTARTGFHLRVAGMVQADRPSPIERLGSVRISLDRRLESLSPFWTAFSLTLTETAGAGILALPIALAGVRPLPGLFILLILGGILSREDLAFLSSVSLESIGDILAYYGAQGEALPCDGGTDV